MSEEQQKKLKEVYQRVQQNKKLLKELKRSARDVLDTHQPYVEANEAIKQKKKELKALEIQLMATNMVDLDEINNLKIDVKTDEEMLKDLALTLLMKNEKVELVDNYDNKFIPELRVAFKKVND